MPGQFLGGRQIGKPGEGVLLLGDLAHHAGNAFGAAVGSRSSHAGDLEPFTRRFGGGFKFHGKRGIGGGEFRHHPPPTPPFVRAPPGLLGRLPPPTPHLPGGPPPPPPPPPPAP